jgi:transcriptional regulator with XRE-family HTH domain
MNRAGVAEFLRTRRDALRPADVGLTPGPRRRAPGLRRDEVAALVGMSTDYYVRLEQARGPQPSEQMLAAIARALRLTLDERDYLFRLAGRTAPARTPLDGHVAPQLMRVLDRLTDTPALILTAALETLAQNDLAVALLGDHAQYAGIARSSVYRWFTDPAERAVYPAEDRDRQSRAQVASLRAA